MTIRFLRPWNGYDDQTPYNLGAAEEARLVGLGLATDALAHPRSSGVVFDGGRLVVSDGANSSQIQSGSVRASRVKYGTFGDSTAALGRTKPQVSSKDPMDIGIFTNTTWSGVNTIAYAPTRDYLPVFYPKALPVWNGGVSGETTADMLVRDASATAASVYRRSTRDVYASGAELIFVRCGINDLKAITNATNYRTIIDTAIANTKLIITRLLSAGVLVVFQGTMGLSDGVSTSGAGVNVDLVKAAALEFNAALAAWLVSVKNAKYFETIGVTKDGAGRYLPGMSDDGLHLNQFGQFTLDFAVASGVLTPMYGESVNIAHTGADLFSNLMFMSASSGRPTGITPNMNSGTQSNERTVYQDGYSWYASTITPAAGSIDTRFDFAFNPTTLGIVAGDKFGFEFPYKIDGIAKNTPVPTLVRGRVDLNDGTNRMVCDIEPGNYAAFGKSVVLAARMQWQPVEILANSASFVDASCWYRFYFVAPSASPIDIWIGQPRIVRNPT